MKQKEYDNLVEVSTGLKIARGVPPGRDLEVWEKLQKTKPKYDDEGNIISYPKVLLNRSNLLTILLGDETFSDLKYNRYSDQVLLDGEMITERDLFFVAVHIGNAYGIQPTTTGIREAVIAAASTREIDPLGDYLKGLKWDGKNRLDKLFSYYFDASLEQAISDKTRADDLRRFSDLVSELGKRWAVSAVARVLSPGCKVDTCLVLVGAKGRGKSTALRVLAGDYFSDSHLDISSKEAYELIHQSYVWLWELAEMHSLHGKSANNAKMFLTATTDRYRPSYGRMPVAKPRRIVFTASTNDWQFLSDGPERRYWPIVVGSKVLVDELQADRNQIWAEAVHLFRRNEKWWLDEQAAQVLEAYQETFIVDDPWKADIEYVMTAKGGRCSTNDIFDRLNLDKSQQHGGNARRIAQICRDMNYTPCTVTDSEGKRRKGWKL